MTAPGILLRTIQTMAAPRRRIEPKNEGGVRTIFSPCDKDEDCLRIDGEFQKVQRELVDAARYQEQYLQDLKRKYAEHMTIWEREQEMYNVTLKNLKNMDTFTAFLITTDEEVKGLFLFLVSELTKHLTGQPSTFDSARAAFITKRVERGGAAHEIEAALTSVEDASQLQYFVFTQLRECEAQIRLIANEMNRATNSYNRTVETLQHMKLPHTCCPAGTLAQGTCRAALIDCHIKGIQREPVTAPLDKTKLDDLQQKAKLYYDTPEARERLTRDKASFFGHKVQRA